MLICFLDVHYFAILDYCQIFFFFFEVACWLSSSCLMMNSDKTDLLLGGRLYMFNVGCSHSNDLLVRNGRALLMLGMVK